MEHGQYEALLEILKNILNILKRIEGNTPSATNDLDDVCRKLDSIKKAIEESGK